MASPLSRIEEGPPGQNCKGLLLEKHLLLRIWKNFQLWYDLSTLFIPDTDSEFSSSLRTFMRGEKDLTTHMWNYRHVLKKGKLFNSITIISHVIFYARQSIKLNSAENELMMFLVNEKSGLLKAKLQQLDDLLHHCLKDKLAPKDFGEKLAFSSIHCDIWNRYAEKVNTTTCFLCLLV
jgi:hypothetical protein